MLRRITAPANTRTGVFSPLTQPLCDSEKGYCLQRGLGIMSTIVLCLFAVIGVANISFALRIMRDNRQRRAMESNLRRICADLRSVMPDDQELRDMLR